MIHEECGVIGIYSPKEKSDIAWSTYYGLFALQHRGQQSCGIAVNDDGLINSYKDVGLVNDVFNKDNLAKLGGGKIAIGHARYCAIGTVTRNDAQPLVIRHVKGQLAITHNGALTNAAELRRKLELKGAIFHSNNDAEIIANIIIQERVKTDTIEEALEKAMKKIQGAYSLVIMSSDKLIAVRDRTGFRPLVMGETKDGQIIFASETCALDTLGAKYIRDIDAGEIVIVDDNGIRSIHTVKNSKPHICIFEYVYFARPDSYLEGISVHEARVKAGRILAKEKPVDADVVIGVPDSGIDAAIGYAQESQIPYAIGFIKNRYIARTFIQPTQTQRANAVKMKLNVVKAVVKGKRVIMVDDSIVRGTTTTRIVKLLRDAGAKEVHVRLSSPPFISPCYYGTDIDSKEYLIACQMSLEEECKFIGADSVGYMSLEGVKQIAKGAKCQFCVGCFSEKYPAPIPKIIGKSKFDSKREKKAEKG